MELPDTPSGGTRDPASRGLVVLTVEAHPEESTDMQTRELTTSASQIDTTAETWDEDGSFSAAVVVAGFIGLTTAALIASAALF